MLIAHTHYVVLVVCVVGVCVCNGDKERQLLNNEGPGKNWLIVTIYLLLLEILQHGSIKSWP